MYLLEEMVELLDGAVGPPESLGGVPQVAHDEAVLPATLPGARAAQVGRRRRTVVHSAQPEIELQLVLLYLLVYVSLTDGRARVRRR